MFIRFCSDSGYPCPHAADPAPAGPGRSPSSASRQRGGGGARGAEAQAAKAPPPAQRAAGAPQNDQRKAKSRAHISPPPAPRRPAERLRGGGDESGWRSGPRAERNRLPGGRPAHRAHAHDLEVVVGACSGDLSAHIRPRRHVDAGQPEKFCGGGGGGGGPAGAPPRPPPPPAPRPRPRPPPAAAAGGAPSAGAAPAPPVARHPPPRRHRRARRRARRRVRRHHPPLGRLPLLARLPRGCAAGRRWCATRCAAAPAAAAATAAARRRRWWGHRDDDAGEHPRTRVRAVTLDASHDRSFGRRVGAWAARPAVMAATKTTPPRIVSFMTPPLVMRLA